MLKRGDERGATELLDAASAFDQLIDERRSGNSDDVEFSDLDTFYAEVPLADALDSAQTLNVPGQFASIQAAVDSAKGGDTVAVASGYSGPGPFDLPNNVAVSLAATVTVDAGGASYGVDVAAGYTGDGLSGLHLTGFVNEGIRQVARSQIVQAALSLANLRVEGGTTGVWVDDAALALNGSYLEGPSSFGILASYDPFAPRALALSDNLIASAATPDPGAVGIQAQLECGELQATISGNTIDGFGVGVALDATGIAAECGAFPPAYLCEIEGVSQWYCCDGLPRCAIWDPECPPAACNDPSFVMVDNLITGWESNGTDCGNVAGTVEHNDAWGAGGAGGAWLDCGGTPPDNLTADPLYCADAGDSAVDPYALRIDSPVGVGNNAWDAQIGVRTVECAFGTLTADAQVPAGEDIRVLEDVTVPSGTTLAIGPGTTFRFDGYDDSGGWVSTSKNELIVDGTLNALGQQADPIAFESAASSPAEGDWFGIRVQGEAHLDHAELRHAEYGITVSGTTGSIRNTAFESNASTDAMLGATSAAWVVEDSTFDVGSGTGVLIVGGNPTVSSSQFTGSSTSLVGLRVNGLAASPLLEDNTLSGFTTGYGIWLGKGSATVLRNVVSGSNRGVYLTDGSHVLGTSVATGNTFQNNTAGLYAQCTGPGACPAACSGTLAAARGNTFAANVNGVVTVKTVGVDLGSSTEVGDNTFDGNTSLCIWNRASTCGTIMAEQNWFGDCQPPLCFNGAVDVGNWLCSPPQ